MIRSALPVQSIQFVGASRPADMRNSTLLTQLTTFGVRLSVTVTVTVTVCSNYYVAANAFDE